MADSTDIIQQFNNPPTPEEKRESDQLRTILADTYTFVRSTEINRTIYSFTFDHYIDEAKRSLKEDRLLRSAYDAQDGIGKRPSKISSLEKLEQDFNNSIEKLRTLAREKDNSTGGVK